MTRWKPALYAGLLAYGLALVVWPGLLMATVMVAGLGCAAIAIVALCVWLYREG